VDWFRFYHEALDDLKVQELPPFDFKGWVNILNVGSRNSPRGQLPPLAQLAFMLRLSAEETKTLCARLVERGLLEWQEDGRLVIHAWAQRQYESDLSTPRVRRHREKTRKRSRNVSETPQNRAEQNTAEQNQTQNKGGPLGLALPDWLPVEPWEAFLEMRKKKGKPATDYAQKRLIGKLDGLKAEGFSPDKVLDQSTVNAWSDLFPVKASNGGSNAAPRKSQRAVPATPDKYAHIKPDLVVS
jgi:hypothetical protein